MRIVQTLRVTALTLILCAAATSARAQGPSRVAVAVTDAEFWSVFTSLSEPSGTFASENFVSNEMTFQHVIPELQRSLTRGGVYLGVGPEQNFTYIANLEPRLAIIVDIRRQNAMQHLMYKALFEQSTTRAQFVSRLFSRPAVAKLAANAKVQEIFRAAQDAPASDSAFAANKEAIVRTLTKQHGFAVSEDDIRTIEYLVGVFYRAGPDVNYAYRADGASFMQSRYPTYGMLQVATNVDSVPMAFLGSESNYQAVRSLHLRNLIIPVVGDFAGPTAIRKVGEFVRSRDLHVTAFYLSNVEQYLFRNSDAAERFYKNVSSLPLDSSATFIRSVPPTQIAPATGYNARGSSPFGSSYSVSIMDSGGVRLLRMVSDSAGRFVMHTLVDSAGTLTSRRGGISTTNLNAQDSTLLRTLNQMGGVRDSTGWRWQTRPLSLYSVVGGGNGGLILASGLAPIRKTLDLFGTGIVRTYQDIIDMTKVNGWK